MHYQIFAVVLISIAALAANYRGRINVISEVTCPLPGDEITYFPFADNCTQYWECYEGNMYQMACPVGLWWHEEISECDYPGDFCDDGTTGFRGGKINVISEVTCPLPGDEITYFPYADNCTQYWECHLGNMYQMACPVGLWWHEEISECDYPGDFCVSP